MKIICSSLFMLMFGMCNAQQIPLAQQPNHIPLDSSFLSNFYLYINRKNIKAYVDLLKKMPFSFIQRIFSTLHQESLEKMAFRLVSAWQYSKNLDMVDAVYFIKNIDFWVNDCGNGEQSDLLSEQHLRYVLPLLEAVLEKQVVTLDLSKPTHVDSKYILKHLPSEICYLSKLEQLYIYGNRITLLPESLFDIITLNSIWTDQGVAIPPILKSRKSLIIVQG